MYITRVPIIIVETENYIVALCNAGRVWAVGFGADQAEAVEAMQETPVESAMVWQAALVWALREDPAEFQSSWKVVNAI